MRGKPLYAYAAIGLTGLILMLVLSFVGVNQKDARLALEGEEDQVEAPQETGDTSDPSALAEETYKASCIGCHGANFDGPLASLTGLADRYSKEEVMAIIKEGVPGTSMPGFNYSEAELGALADYLLEATK